MNDAVTQPAASDAPAGPWSSWSRAELLILVVGVLYCVGPWRFPWGDVVLFIGAFVVLLATGAYLRPTPDRPAQSPALIGLTLAVSGLLAAAFLVYGVLTDAPGLTPAKAALTLAIYLPFALFQQAITQGFLVARLRRGFALLPAALIGGALFALCHLPFQALIAPTLLIGAIWAAIFLATGKLWPLVVSHALLGSTFILGVIGQDPFRHIL